MYFTFYLLNYLHPIELILFFIFLIAAFDEKFNSQLCNVPEHPEGESHKEPQGSTELRHKGSERIEENFRPLGRRLPGEHQEEVGLVVDLGRVQH